MIDRTKAPKYKYIDKINIPNVEIIELSNGIKVYFVKSFNEDISEISFIFKTGVWQQKHLLAANSTIKMMAEGTKTHSSVEIAGIFDYFGAYFSSLAGMHLSYFKVMCLNKYIPQVTKIMGEIIQEPVFPENEFEIYRRKTKQSLILDLEEESNIARNELEEAIFGADYPYGWAAKPEDYDKLKIEWLKEYYADNINSKNLYIIATGSPKKMIIDELEKEFGEFKNESKKLQEIEYQINSGEKYKYIEREDAMQAAVRVGWKLFERTNEDYIDMSILDTLIGGYFGSRLMQNIRQKKGYTYSIYSMMKCFEYSGAYEIISEVNKDSKFDVVEEIKKEMNKIRSEVISPAEMENLRNYLSGYLLRGLDGVFNYSRALGSHIYYDLGFDYFNKFFDRIKTIQPERLTELAQKYLDPEEMFTVIVG